MVKIALQAGSKKDSPGGSSGVEAGGTSCVSVVSFPCVVRKFRAFSAAQNASAVSSHYWSAAKLERAGTTAADSTGLHLHAHLYLNCLQFFTQFSLKATSHKIPTLDTPVQNNVNVNANCYSV